MSGKVLHAKDGLTGEEALAAALTSASPVTAAMARGSATGAVELLSDWINAELQRPKAAPVDVIQALAKLQLQMLGSLAAQLGRPEGDTVFVEDYLDMARDLLPEHMARTREAMS